MLFNELTMENCRDFLQR